MLSSEHQILRSSGQRNKNVAIFIHCYIYSYIIYRHIFIENLLYAILITGFIAISHIKILLTWNLQCSEDRYIIDMQELNSAVSGNIQEKRGLVPRKRC